MVSMPATGDVGYAEREVQLARPLLRHGVASMIVEAPFSGARAPMGQVEHYVDNVRTVPPSFLPS